MMTITKMQEFTREKVKSRTSLYWKLIKSLQTGLLLVTGLAGYMSARCPLTSWDMLLAVIGSLFLAISGSTILNMVYDCDIDAKMTRTARRPLPSGEIGFDEALFVGLSMVWLGVTWAFMLSPLFGALVFAGVFIDVAIYTIWLKRRTSWSVVWGGIAGAMPVLSGRALSTGEIDLVGVLLALSVLFWIPTHMLTFGLKYSEDYHRATVPVFANTHGKRVTHWIIGLSTVAAAVIMVLAVWMIGIHLSCLLAIGGLATVLLGLTFLSLLYPSSKLNFGVFKFASLYMLGTMSLIIVGV